MTHLQDVCHEASIAMPHLPDIPGMKEELGSYLLQRGAKDKLQKMLQALTTTCSSLGTEQEVDDDEWPSLLDLMRQTKGAELQVQDLKIMEASFKKLVKTMESNEVTQVDVKLDILEACSSWWGQEDEGNKKLVQNNRHVHALASAMASFQADKASVVQMLELPDADDHLRAMMRYLKLLEDVSTEAWGGAIWNIVVAKAKQYKHEASVKMLGGDHRVAEGLGWCAYVAGRHD